MSKIPEANKIAKKSEISGSVKESSAKKMYVLYYVDWDDGKRKDPSKDVLGVFSTREKAVKAANDEELIEDYGTTLDSDDGNRAFLIVERDLNRLYL